MWEHSEVRQCVGGYFDQGEDKDLSLLSQTWKFGFLQNSPLGTLNSTHPDLSLSLHLTFPLLVFSSVAPQLSDSG